MWNRKLRLEKWDWETKFWKPADVAIHNRPDDCWVSFNGIVMDLTPLVTEYRNRPEVLPLLAEAGKDISHWFDKDGNLRTFTHPILGTKVPYLPHGPIPHLFDYNLPTTKWKPAPLNSWWRDPKYVIGKLTKSARPVRIFNNLTKMEITLTVCAEETINQILERYLPYNQKARSYTWKYEGNVLDMDLTLEQNGIKDRKAELRRLVADNYGVSTYALYLFLLTIWWSRNWGEATACPYTHFEELVEGKTWISHAIVKVLCQLAGGLLTYRYILYLWNLEVSPNHRGRAHEACTADLQVSAIMGAIIEGCATCVCRTLSRALAEVQTKFGTELEAFVGTSLVVAAFNYSGGYFNPALATSLKYGCAGHSVAEHIFVYWIGSSAGAIASIYMFELPSIKSTVAKYKIKTE